jgi:hypothetical protein
MNRIIRNKLISVTCIMSGIVIFIFVAGPFLLRLVIALFALSLINFGLSLRGLPSIQFTLRSWVDLFRIF